jgi:RNA polymerase sigma-70 factor, ECF subfamily
MPGPLASRARHRVRGAPSLGPGELVRQREVVNAFLSVVRAGDFDGLVAVLDPDVVFRADVPARPGGSHRSTWCAKLGTGCARLCAGALHSTGADQRRSGAGPRAAGTIAARADLRICRRRIHSAEVIADPTRLRALNVAVLP